jgi:hypothetical protein
MNAHRIALASTLWLIAGCSTMPPPEPVYVASPLPSLPAECESICPAEPKLPVKDISAADVAKDRTAFKRALRCERHQRRTCAARLKVLGVK